MALQEFFLQLNPSVQALLATLFTWSVTALGAATVFATRRMNQMVLDCMLGFAAGVMIAASFWSLLQPAIELSAVIGPSPWLPPLIGFLLGGLSLAGLDKLLPHLHPDAPREQAEGVPTTWRRSLLLVLAITLHNIPEGLAVGVAFGAAAAGLEGASVTGAVILAIGIGLQNFPEGAAVSMPLRGEGMSRLRSFLYGQSSALVEPVAALIGVSAVSVSRASLPYALSFAAGAMLYVVVEELIPQAHNGRRSDLPTVATLAGFALMMALDVGLG